MYESVHVRMFSVCAWCVCMYVSVYVCVRMFSVCAWYVCMYVSVYVCVRMFFARVCVYIFLHVRIV